VAGDAGAAIAPTGTPCMPIGGESGGSAADGCCASAANASSDPTRTSTRPGVCDECICGNTPTSASASWSTLVV